MCQFYLLAKSQFFSWTLETTGVDSKLLLHGNESYSLGGRKEEEKKSEMTFCVIQTLLRSRQMRWSELHFSAPAFGSLSRSRVENQQCCWGFFFFPFRGRLRLKAGQKKPHDCLHSVHRLSDMTDEWMDGWELKMTREEQRAENRADSGWKLLFGRKRSK